MRKLLFLALIGFSLASCNKTGDFDLSFHATWDSNPLVLNESQSYGDLNLKFENLTFYLSDVSLTNDDGETIELSDVEFVELNSFTETDAINGQTFSFTDLPAGKYTKFSFSIGVPPDLNATTPEDYNVSDVLGKTDYYWGPWASYIFSKIEGNADTDGNGEFDLKFFYHTGSNALFRSFEINRDIIIDDKNPTNLELYIDYDVLLRDENEDYFNISEFPKNHKPEDLDALTALVDNYVKAIKFRD